VISLKLVHFQINDNNDTDAAVILLFCKFSCLRLCASEPKNNDHNSNNANKASEQVNN